MEDVRYINMTEKEKDAWLTELATLCVDMFIEEQLKQTHDKSTTHTPEQTQGLT